MMMLCCPGVSNNHVIWILSQARLILVVTAGVLYFPRIHQLLCQKASTDVPVCSAAKQIPVVLIKICPFYIMPWATLICFHTVHSASHFSHSSGAQSSCSLCWGVGGVQPLAAAHCCCSWLTGCQKMTQATSHFWTKRVFCVSCSSTPMCVYEYFCFHSCCDSNL